MAAVRPADYRFARRPAWLAGHLLVVVLLATFVALGLWQLRRLDDRRATNELVAARVAEPPVPVGDLVGPGDGGDAVEAVRFRPVTVTGTYVRSTTTAVRATQDGRTGARVFSRLALEDGGTVVVLRGFVAPQADDDLVEPEPPSGLVDLEGVAIPTDRLEGTFEQAVDDMVEGLPDVLPVVVQAGAPDAEAMVIVPAPELGDGPHLGYAVQWFLFAAVGVVGYPVLLRRRGREAEAGDTVGDG